MSQSKLSWQAIVYALCLALHVGLIWYLPYFPTQDGPSHIYNLVILRDLIDGGAVWGEFYNHRIFVGPSMGFITATYPLLALFSPMAAEKLFLSIYVLLTGVATPLLCKAGGKPALPVSFLTLPMLFCYPVMMGFYSYILGIPLLLFALAFYWTWRNKGFWTKLAAINLIGLALFWCHVLVFLLFLLALAAWVLSQPARFGALIRRSLEALAQTALPLIATAWYFFPRWASGGMQSSRSLHPRVLARAAVNLVGLSIDTFSPFQFGLGALYLGMLIILAARSISKYLKNGRLNRETAAFDRWLTMCALLTTLLYLLTPDQFGVLGLIKLRLPIVIVLLTLPALSIVENARARTAVTIAILLVAASIGVVNFVLIGKEAKKADNFMQGLSQPLGERKVILTYNADCETPIRVDVIKHLASYYGIKKGYFDAGNYEAAMGVFNTSFKPAYSLRPKLVEIEERPWTIDWEKYPSIEYVLGWRLTPRDRERLSGRYKIFFEQQELSIWKRTPII